MVKIENDPIKDLRRTEMQGYTKDHVVVMKVLGREIPKRPTLSTKEVVGLGFKGKDNGDRIVRNAYRKLKEKELVEIADRGRYRLTPMGVSFVKTVKEKGDGAVMHVAAEKVKSAPKKAAKPAKKVAKAAPAKKPTKKAAPKKAVKAAAKPAAKKAAPKKATVKVVVKAPSNGKSAINKLSGAMPKKAETEVKAETKSATLPM